MKKRFFAFASAFIVFAGTLSSGAASGSGASYLYDTKGRSVAAPETYTAERVYDGDVMGIGHFKNPSDVFTDSRGFIYIADTGNNRVVITDRNFRVTRIITEISGLAPERLSAPSGVFFASDSLLYIADTGNNRVIALDGENRAKRRLTKEGLFAVNSQMLFKPEKVAVDTDGSVYVIDKSIYQGIARYDADGSFLGFFAPNQVEITASAFLLSLWKKILNSAQTEAMEKTLPSPYNNLYMDGEDFIYTCAANVPVGSELKKLNAEGVNILLTADGSQRFGDLETVVEDGLEQKNSFADIHADENGMICAADSNGKLFFYDNDCNLIGIAGGSGDRAGMFRTVSAVEKLGDEYLVLDADKGNLTVLAPTAYMRDVLEAMNYYNQGLYVEASGLWQNILARNSNFAIAYRSLGRALLQQGNSKDALKMLRKGGDRYFYSIAFAEYRKEFARKYFLLIVFGSAATVVGLVLLLKRARRWMLCEKT